MSHNVIRRKLSTGAEAVAVNRRILAKDGLVVGGKHAEEGGQVEADVFEDCIEDVELEPVGIGGSGSSRRSHDQGHDRQGGDEEVHAEAQPQIVSERQGRIDGEYQ